MTRSCGETIEEFATRCGTCRRIWVEMDWRFPEPSAPVQCLWCCADFCGDHCYKEHEPCESHPGNCTACDEDGLEPTSRGDFCAECHTYVEEK